MAPFTDLDAYRSEFPVVEEQLYFNHAGVAPTSRRAVAAIQEWSEDLLRHGSGPGSRTWSPVCSS